MILAGVLAQEKTGGIVWGYYKALTVDHTKCGSSDSSDFPVLVSFMDANLKTVANGGHVNNANGFDIGFSSDTAGSAGLPFELVKYDGSTGLVEFWVSLGTLSSSVDTVFYVQYGSTFTTDRSNTGGVWASAYKAVYHLGDGSTLSLADSSQSGNTLTNNGGVAAVAGEVGGAASLAGTLGSGGSYLLKSSGAGLPTGAGPGPITIEGWFKLSGNQGAAIFGFGGNPGGFNSRFSVAYSDPNLLFAEFGDNDQTIPFTYDTNWHHVVMVMPSGDNQTDQVMMYLDGVPQTVTSLSNGTLNLSVNDIVVGAIPGYYSGGAATPLNGYVDEVRMGTYAPTADWVTAEFNNQGAPGTFMSVGSETAH